MELKIYDKQGIVKMTVSPDNSSQWNHEVGVENVVTVNFTTWEFLVLEVGWYILVEGQRFSIKSEYRPKHIHDTKYTYNLKFYGREHDTQDILFCRLNQGEDDLESVFAYDGTPMEFLNKVVANMNRNTEGMVWKAGEAISVNRKTINFNGLYCWDALNEISRTFGTEWWMDGEYLNISKCERGESVSLGYGQGLKSGLTQNENTNAVKWFTRLIPVGSSKNIDKNKYGYTTLQLPGREKYIDINTQYGLKEYREEAAFSEIYPHRVGTISSVRSETRTNEETGEYTVLFVKDSSLPFNPDEYMIGGEVIHMTFNSGALAGKDFEVNWNNETKEFEIINQYPDDNTQLPGGNLVPNADDEYVLWNISMPDEYIRAAEQEYKEAVDAYLAEYSKDISIYSGNTDYIYIDQYNVPLLLGQRVRLLSGIYFGNIGRDSRITRVSRKLNNLSDATIDCSDAIASSWKSSVDSSLNQLQFAVSNEMAQALIQILKTGEPGTPSDYNVLSALRSLKTFLRKDKDDETPFKISVGDKLTAKKGIQIGESFIPGILTGSGGYFDEYANGEVESLIIRRFLEVPELRFNRVQVTLGDKWNAPGAGVIERVIPDSDTTGTVFLKLEEGEYGAIAVGDICMGIFHSMNSAENATEDSDDSYGNFQFAGFYTCYFTITEITGKDNKQFRYQMRPVSDRWKLTIHPSEAMTFVCYGSFVREDRQTSVYTTRTYTRLLKNQNTWEINASNIAMQYGDMTNMNVHGLDMTGYSMYLNNIYMTGTLKQVKPDGTPVNVANDRGNWVSGTVYDYYDRVSHNGSLWLCVNESGTNTEPSKGNSDWLLQVASGDSLVVGGRFSSAKTPYSPNSVIDFAGKVWASTDTVDYAPYGIWTDASGNRFQFGDGGFCLVDEELRSGWTLFMDVQDVKDGKDGASFYAQFSADGKNWHDTFVEGDIYMRQKVGEDSAWSDAIRIVGEAGAAGKNGEYTEYEFAVNDSIDTPPTSGWQDAPPAIGKGQYLWMRMRVVKGDGTVGNWSTPVRLKGEKGDSVEFVGHFVTGVEVPYLGVVYMGGSNWVAKVKTTNPPLWCWTDANGNRFQYSDGGFCLTGEENTEEYELLVSNGKDGADGTDYEFIFFNTTEEIRPETPATKQVDDYIPSGWHDDAVGVSESVQYEWMSMRRKKDGLWGSYSTPSLWAKFGEDGTNYEFVYTRTKTESKPSTPSSKQQDDYIPSGWTDDPIGTSDEYPYEWMSKRRKKGSVWGEYTTPALWSNFSILSFKATAFIRTNDAPLTPTGGSYDSPVPTSSPKWYDGIPSGEETLWASTRVFTKNGTGIQDSSWSEPRRMTDTSSFEVIYHASESEPKPPTNYPNTTGAWTPNNGWTDDPTTESVWMATATKANGVWGAWQVSKIKGEKGVDGKDGKDYEYIYQRTTYGSPSRPESLQEDDYVPDGWTDDPMGVTDYYLYEWTCKRTKKDGVWGEFSYPALWAKFGVNGTDGKDGKDGQDGEQGKQGIQGCILRKSEWKEGVEYRNDEEEKSGTRYVDVVLVRNENATTGWDAYKCIETHTSTHLTKPPHSGFFEPFGIETTSIFTSLIIAKDASIDFMQGNELLIKGSDGVTVEAGLSGSSATGGDVRLWVGGETPDDAPFTVDKYGNVVATNATITGIIKGATIEGALIVGTGAYKAKINPSGDYPSITWGDDSKPYVWMGMNTPTGGYLSGQITLRNILSSSAIISPNAIQLTGDSNFGVEINASGYSSSYMSVTRYIAGSGLYMATLGIDSNNRIRLGASYWPTASSQVNVGEVYSDNGTLKIRLS